jgi:ribosomal protein L32
MKCYNCGHDQKTGRFCDTCGMMVTRMIIENEGHEHEADGDEKRPDDLRCKCGHVQKTGRFCDKCGVMFDFYRAQPDDDALSRRCPACGTMSKTRVCRNCGVKIPGFPSVEE